MPMITRRAALATAVGAATSVSWASRGRAAEFTYKYASNLPITHPLNARMKEAAEAIRAETNGRFEIQVFPSSQLGGDLEVLSQLRTGAIEMYQMAGAQLSNLVPIATLNAVGFAFNDMDQVWQAMDGDVGKLIRDAVVKANLFIFAKAFDNGFRQITSSTKAIRSPADLKGFAIRVPPSPLSTSLFKALGASPQSIDYGQVYTALQTNLVSGQENPVSIIENGKLYEVQKYISMTNHMWDGFWILANPDAWNRLPADVREIAQRHIETAAVREREDVQRLNDTVLEQLKSKGMEVINPDRAAFRATVKGTSFYADWKKRFGNEAWSALEKYAGTLS